MEKEIFGKLENGDSVYLYRLKNENASAEILSLGGVIREFKVYEKSIVGGFDTLADYLIDTSHQGALIGRVANRIEGGAFTIDGKEYSLYKNDGNNTLHGGEYGFDSKLWTLTDSSVNSITLSYVSPDGEENFPGELTVSVTYKLEGSALLIDYTASATKKTPIALTNHAYFNLDGFGSDIMEHTLTIDADTYTEVNDELIPTGRRSVEGTIFDFRSPKTIGRDVSGSFIGYDHNFVLNQSRSEEMFGYTLPFAVRAENDMFTLDVFTDMPGVQLYIGNFLEGGPDFSGGAKKIIHGAFCLETQTEPNCIKHGEGIYDAGEVYRHRTVYRVAKK